MGTAQANQLLTAQHRQAADENQRLRETCNRTRRGPDGRPHQPASGAQGDQPCRAVGSSPSIWLSGARSYPAEFPLPRSLVELSNIGEPAWPELESHLRTSGVPGEILPIEPYQAAPQLPPIHVTVP